MKELGTENCYDISDPTKIAMECALDYCLEPNLQNCVILDSNYIDRIGRTFYT